MNKPTRRIRVQKYLSEQGLCSRRLAETWISESVVTVNGTVVALGAKVDPSIDRVTVRGKRVQARPLERCTIMMNKPRGYLCTNRDPYHTQTVFTLLSPTDLRYRLFSAGRLDKESEGLIILTNDGDFANRLTHPGSRVVKRYQVTLNHTFQTRHAAVLCKGINEGGEFLQAEKVVLSKKGGAETNRLEIHLHHGKKREIRRLLEAFGYRVTRLRRFQIGGLILRGIGPGRYRRLKNEELRLLFA